MQNFNLTLFPDTWPKALPPDELIITCINIFFVYITRCVCVCFNTNKRRYGYKLQMQFYFQ